MNDILQNKPAFTLSVGELIEIVKAELTIIQNPTPIPKIEPQKQFAYSIKEAAEYFHISPVTCQSWKNKGYVKYRQQGRKLIIDLQGTLDLLGSKKKGTKL